MMHSSDLTVDFPQETHRAGVEFKLGTRPNLRFSGKIEVRFYRRADDSTSSELHYSEEDYRNFKRDSKRAIKEARRLLSFPDDDDSVRALHECVVITGIENSLTPELLRRSATAKILRTNAVLNEQDRQDSMGIYDEERLAMISRQCSEWSVQRAVKIGMLQRAENITIIRARLSV